MMFNSVFLGGTLVEKKSQTSLVLLVKCINDYYVVKQNFKCRGEYLGRHLVK